MGVARRKMRTGLDALFLPDSVAVIGATEREGTVGRTILESGRVFGEALRSGGGFRSRSGDLRSSPLSVRVEKNECAD